MATTTDDLTLRMRAQGARSASRDVDRTTGSVRRFGKQSNIALRQVTRLGGGLRTVTGGAAALGVAFGATALVLGKQAIGEFRESQKVGNQTSAVLKSMGATAWTSSKQVGDLANSLSVKSGIDDEAIQSASNLLLTFGKVRNEAGKGNDIFNRATAAAVDLSAAGFGSMTSTSKQLGKALNDPVKGITALNKSGVTFTDKQKKTIKGLVAQNKTLDAQKIIMREVERQVKGSAAAQADPLDKLTVAWKNMLEVAGKPIWAVVTKGINRVIGPLTHVSSVASEVFDDKNLNWQQKFQRIGRSIRHWFGPIADDMIAALKAAHLDQKLNALIKWASPQISAAFRAVAPAAAKGLIEGFKSAPAWAQLLTAGFLLTKVAAMAPALRLAGAAAGTTFGTAMGPAAWTVLGAYLLYQFGRHVQDWTGKPGEKPTRIGPKGHKATVMSTQNTQGRSLSSDVLGRIFGGRHTPATDPGPSRGGNPLGPDPIIHIHTHLDGKEVARNQVRVATKKKATR
jgi:hypothetical protein